jgi:hypothetical protein
MLLVGMLNGIIMRLGIGIHLQNYTGAGEDLKLI